MASAKKSARTRDYLDPKHIRKITPNRSSLKISLRKGPKGTSIFATKTIRSGSVIAYYRMIVKRNATAKTVNKRMYIFTIYTKTGRASSVFVGDVCKECMLPPKNGIPYWAQFSNEPSVKQDSNAYIDTNLAGNYRNRDRVKEGDFMVYKLRATKTINPGEEILWCYGDNYGRHYKTSCEA